jgi:hypothetical protein
MPPTGFEPTISANARPQIDTAERAATVIGKRSPTHLRKISHFLEK